MVSCSTVDVYHMPGRGIGNGPPAHAEAHGYRRKQIAGVEMVFDSALGLYVVVGYPDCYYCDGYFYRLNDAVWEMSLQPDHGWTYISVRSLPRGLQAKSNGRYKDHPVVYKDHPVSRSGKGKKF